MSSFNFDKDLAEWVPLIPKLDITDVVAARALRAEVAAAQPAFVVPESVTVVRRAVPGAEGDPDVDVLVFAPATRTGPLPGVLYIHGGGFVLGDAAADAKFLVRVVEEVGAVVVSVEYRLAPESRFPAAVEDCHAALTWLAQSAGELGVDGSRIAVVGRSAGAGIGAGTVLMARDRGGPPVCFQLLDIPELDDRLDTPSMQSSHDTPTWNHPNAVLSWNHYLGPEADRSSVSEYAAPARARDLSGLPPTFVSVCEFDPLRDEGIIHAQRLVQAGVSTELHLYPGTFHGSSTAVPTAAISIRMDQDRIECLQRALAPLSA